LPEEVIRKRRRNIMTKLIAIALLLTVIAFMALGIACQKARQTVTQPAQAVITETPLRPQETPSPDLTIDSIDFENFTFSAKKFVPNIPESITLEKGKYKGVEGGDDPMTLRHVTYVEVTGDQNREAIVVLESNTGGTAIPHVTYVYTMERNKPLLLWAFETGDRGAGGLRNVYGESGQLVIELYGVNKTIGKNLYDQEVGICCPEFYTRARYKWKNNQFQIIGEKEILPNTEGHGSPIMPLIPHKNKQ
jgi:hypothetical protein